MWFPKRQSSEHGGGSTPNPGDQLYLGAREKASVKEKKKERSSVRSIQIVPGHLLPVKARPESESKHLGTFVACDLYFTKVLAHNKWEI